MSNPSNHNREQTDKLPKTKSKPYESPTLTEYGNIQEITKGQAGAGFDAGGTFRPI